MNLSFKSSGGGDKIFDVIKRVKTLEVAKDDHEERIAALEEKIQALSNALNGVGSSGAEDAGAPADNGKLNLRMNLLSEELNRKADKTELQHQATIF